MSGGYVQFVDTQNEKAADIVCKWTNDTQQIVDPLESGHSEITSNGHWITHVEIKLLTVSKDTNNKNISDQLARKTYLHEIGHALGLIGHSHDPADIMFFVNTSDILNGSITQRDSRTLLLLYKMDLQ